MIRGAGLGAVPLLLALAACSGDSLPTIEEQTTAPKIVTLAPHLAELVHAAGAGEGLVGVSAYTDYPPEAAALPQVGDAFGVDQERLKLLAPDLVFVWESGTPSHTVEELKAVGLPIVTLRTRRLEDVAVAIEEIGRLTGNDETARVEAARFRDRLRALGEQHTDREPLRVFYQISSRPLYTVNGDHFISELIELCGASNVFDDLSELAPQVEIEAVLGRDPEAIVGGGGADAFSVWERFENLAANRYGNRLSVDVPALSRASTRLDAAGTQLCEVLDQARENRAESLADP